MKLVYAVVPPNKSECSKVDQNTLYRFRDLTITWSRYGYSNEIIDGESIDAVLHQAEQAGYDFCLVQRYGHVIDEQWYLPHWQQSGFYKNIENLLKSESFLVAGKLSVSNSGCLGLYEDCLLVNLQTYRKIGQPNFGDADAQVRSLYVEEGSERYSHSVRCNMPGWHFVHQSLHEGLPVVSFSEEVDRNRFDLMHQEEMNDFVQCLGQPIEKVNQAGLALNDEQSQFVERVKPQILKAKNSVCLLNAELYDELKVGTSNRAIDALFSLAVGFKPYRILATQGFKEDTKVVLFDCSTQALEIRKEMVEQWDGEDFPELMHYLFSKYPSPDGLYQLWSGATPSSLNWHDLGLLWKQELEKWGGEESFKQCWNVLRQLPHEFMHCDLLKDQKQLMHNISQYRNPYISWGNAFFTVFSHWHYSYDERKQSYTDWVAALAKTSPQCQINGADHNNCAVSGLTAEAYLIELNNDTLSELLPLNLQESP